MRKPESFLFGQNTGATHNSRCVEHDMEFVRTLDGHVTVLHQGELFAEGDIEQLRSDDRVLDIYLGRREHV